MSAYLEPPCDHPTPHVELYDCGCEYCHACEERVNVCTHTRRCAFLTPEDAERDYLDPDWERSIEEDR